LMPDVRAPLPDCKVAKRAWKTRPNFTGGSTIAQGKRI
jgi:hypothetical protein